MATQPAVPVELLSARETFAHSWCERWLKGHAADRRVRQLRRAFGASVATRTVHDNRRLWTAAGADRVALEITEITYCARREQIPAPIVDAPKAA